MSACLHSVEMRSFKKHPQLAVQFGDGLTAITGDNARGKSTVLKGILFALFGVRAVGLAENIQTWDSTVPTEVKLTYTLPVHGKVVITRTLKNCKIHDAEGTLLANGATACGKLIEEAYGMDSAHLQLLLVARQGESQGLLALGATALQTTVERLAKVDLIDKVIKALGQDVDFMRGSLHALGEPADLGALDNGIQTQTVARDAAVATHEQLRTELQVALQAMTAAVAAHGEADSRERRYQAAYAAVEAHHRQIQSWEVELLQAEALQESYPADLERAYQNAEQSERSYLNQISQINPLLVAIRDVEMRLKAAEFAATQAKDDAENSAQVEGLLKSVCDSILVAQEVATTKKAEEAQAREAAEDARKALDTGVCHHCQRPFSGVDIEAAQRHQEEAKAAWRKADDALTAAKAHLSALQQDEVSLRRRYRPDAEHKRASTQLAWEQAQADYASATQAAGALLEGEPSYESVRAGLERKKETLKLGVQKETARREHLGGLLKAKQLTQAKVEAAEATLNQLSIRQQELQQHLDVAVADLQDTAALQVQAEAAAEKYNQTSQQKLVAEQAAATADTELLRLVTDRQKAEEATRKRDELAKGTALRARLQAWLRKSRSSILSEMWEGLLGFASHLLSTTTSGVLSRVYREEDVLWVVEDSRPVPASELSGYQRSLLGVALRIAMSRVFFGQEHVLLLDEPTADSAAANSARVAGMLKGLGSQVVFVTHEEGDAANAGSVINL